jgi:hypothetical protein
MTAGDRDSWVAQLVDAACCVVGGNAGVKSITVVANHRMRYGELARLREHAMACHTDFSVGGSGTVIVRRAGNERSAASGQNTEPAKQTWDSGEERW